MLTNTVFILKDPVQRLLILEGGSVHCFVLLLIWRRKILKFMGNSEERIVNKKLMIQSDLQIWFVELNWNELLKNIDKNWKANIYC